MVDVVLIRQAGFCICKIEYNVLVFTEFVGTVLTDELISFGFLDHWLLTFFF